jgi:hypothetical protein
VFLLVECPGTLSLMLRLSLALAFGLVVNGCSSGDSTQTRSGPADGAAQTSCSSGTTCEQCMACALAGPCKPKVDACAVSSECKTFGACIAEKDDAATAAACRTQQPSGATAFCAYMGCAAYTQCGALCEPAVACPR